MARGPMQLHRLEAGPDYRSEFPALNDLARKTFCVMATSPANARVLIIDGRVVNSRRENLKEFVSEELTQQCS